MNAPQSPKSPPQQPEESVPKAATISEMIGGALVLPGESAELYQASLNLLTKELEASSLMQVYLAEKIHDCLWWIRRYEEQKRATLIAEMAALTRDVFQIKITDAQAQIRNAMLTNKVDKKTLEAIGAAGHTIESLRQFAMEKKSDALIQLDEQIALQMKILMGFQASYEVAFNRKINVDRLALQNELMRRDLQSIEGAVNDKPKAARRKST